MAGTPYGYAAGLLGTPPMAAQYMPRVYEVSLTPAAVATITTAEQTFTVTGLTTDDAVFVSPPGHQAGVVAAAARVSAADTLAITFVNPTAGNVTPTAGTYKVVAFKVG